MLLTKETQAMIQEEIIKKDQSIIIQKTNKRDLINFKSIGLLDQKKEFQLDRHPKINIHPANLQFKTKYQKRIQKV